MTDRIPKDVRRYPDGEPILILRPDNPAEVIALAKVSLAHKSDEAMREAYRRPLRFLGYLVKRGGKFLAVDANGDNPVEMQPGDMFAAPNDVRRPD